MDRQITVGEKITVRGPVIAGEKITVRGSVIAGEKLVVDVRGSVHLKP